MNKKGRLTEYLLITGLVWVFYAFTLPVYFYFVFHWNFSDVVKWWTTGTLVEFILAYPLGKILAKVVPKINLYCEGLN